MVVTPPKLITAGGLWHEPLTGATAIRSGVYPAETAKVLLRNDAEKKQHFPSATFASSAVRFG
jgi:hypothetical protein